MQEQDGRVHREEAEGVPHLPAGYLVGVSNPVSPLCRSRMGVSTERRRKVSPTFLQGISPVERPHTLEEYASDHFRSRYACLTNIPLKVHKIEHFFDSDFGICIISLLVMSK